MLFIFMVTEWFCVKLPRTFHAANFLNYFHTLPVKREKKKMLEIQISK